MTRVMDGRHERSNTKMTLLLRNNEDDLEKTIFKNMTSKYGPRIVVPQKAIQGGTDFKFISDPYRMELYGMLQPEEYTQEIEKVNKRMKRARANFIDGALLATGALIVPLMLWGIRHRGQVKKRKHKLKKAIHDFNTQYPHLLMRWNPKPESKLTIERREEQQEQQQHKLSLTLFLITVLKKLRK